LLDYRELLVEVVVHVNLELAPAGDRNNRASPMGQAAALPLDEVNRLAAASPIGGWEGEVGAEASCSGRAAA
jgi:hypothetical protein